MSLLASEAVVDSRDTEILSAEETDELKKEQQLLSSRLGAMTKKLNLETKIRDAAMSLSKVNASHKRVSKQTDEQLESANRRVELAQRELWRVSERSNEVHRKLLEHRAGVLAFSVRSLESKMTVPPPVNGTDESAYSTPNRSSQMGPVSSVTSASTSSKPRFDGAHLFAGHADAVIPKFPKGPLSNSDVAELEEKLKTVNQAMDAATTKQAETARELSLLRLEKEQVETTMAMELQTAEETIMSLEKELPRLEGLNTQLEDLRREKKAWEKERETLEGRLEVLEENSADAMQLKQLLADAKELSTTEIKEMRAQWESDKAQWERDKAESAKVREELEGGVNALRLLTATHGIPVMSGNVQLSAIVDSVGLHLAEVASRLQTPEGGLDNLSDASKITTILMPIWSMLPSPELRAAKLSGGRPVHPYRSGSQGQNPSPTASPSLMPSSLSDMDVRSLKMLYDSRVNTPSSPNVSVFSIEGFTARVQALIADDRSLIERLLRFAQAHDLLKKNAERAQKLATESNNALETYQKQVRTLEERNLSMADKQAALQDEVQALQEAVNRITTEKREIEKEVTAQTQANRQLTQANNTHSTRVLALAEEAATAPEKVRKELTAQLMECKAKLKEAQDELDAMRKSDQSQTEALLDELNSLQTDNGNLRAQLRAVRK